MLPVLFLLLFFVFLFVLWLAGAGGVIFFLYVFTLQKVLMQGDQNYNVDITMVLSQQHIYGKKQKEEKIETI